MNHNISTRRLCTNCGSCYNACPAGAIYVNEDSMFYQPVVNETLCIQCGKCLQVCPLEREQPQTKVYQAVWGWHRDKTVVYSSSSGGAFTALAEQILEEDGVVFAACFDEQKRVRIRSTDCVSLGEFRKSKYVESLVGDAFRLAEEQLLAGRTVMFCGAPCQIAGLKQYLGKEYKNLFTCDFACGGFSSHKLFAQYLQILEKKYGAPAETVDFRPKRYSWNIHSIAIRFANGKRYIRTGIADPFFYSFLYASVNKRECCYDCKFAQQHSSDMILADFWKYRQLTGGKTPKTGVSLILACTQKGNERIQKLHNSMVLTEISPEKAAYILEERCRDETLMKRREIYLRCCEETDLCTAAERMGMPRGIKAFLIQCKHTVKGVFFRFLWA